MSGHKHATFGPEEFGVLYPTFIGEPPDRVFFLTDPRKNTLEWAEAERQRWIDRGLDAYVITRQWKVI